MLLYQKRFEQFSRSPWASLFIFCWAFLEASVWFIFPEFLLVLLVLGAPKRSLNFVGWAAVGSLLGGSVGFIASRYDPVAAQGLLNAVPLITPGMIAQVHLWFAENGTLAVLYQLLSLIPYKTFVLLSGHYQLDFILFILLSALARIPRFLLATLVVSGVSRIIKRKAAHLFWALYPLLVLINLVMIIINTARY
jgi:membrane protein YqaA with SNARE-associated domain